MGCCCNKIFKICRIAGVCEGAELVVDTDLPNGSYILVTSFLSKIIKIETTAQGGRLWIQTGGLNENFTYQGTIEKLSGEQVNILTDFDCVVFNTGLL